MIQIKVKATGLLTKHLPARTQGDEAMVVVPDGATAIDVMRQLGIPPEGSYLLVLNGAVLPVAERPSTRLAENDSLAIMPPLKGG